MGPVESGQSEQRNSGRASSGLSSNLRWRLTGVLGAIVVACAVFVVPALAGSDGTPTIELITKTGVQYSNEQYSWAPEQVTVSPGGTVNFANSSPGSPHGLVWKEVPTTPVCTGVPVGSSSEEAWKGTCTFSQAGTYTFYDQSHQEAKGLVTVSGATVITTATTATQRSHVAGENSSSPYVGGLTAGIVIAKSQHGSAVKVSVNIAEAGVKGKLTVSLLAKKVLVGKTAHGSLKTGKLSFSVPLSAAGKKALKKKHSLALTVKLSLKPFYGAAINTTRSVTLKG